MTAEGWPTASRRRGTPPPCGASPSAPSPPTPPPSNCDGARTTPHTSESRAPPDQRRPPPPDGGPPLADLSIPGIQGVADQGPTSRTVIQMSIHKHVSSRGTSWEAVIRGPDGKERSRRFSHTRPGPQAWEGEQRAARATGRWIDPRRGPDAVRLVGAGQWLSEDEAKAPGSRATDASIHPSPPGAGARRSRRSVRSRRSRSSASSARGPAAGAMPRTRLRRRYATLGRHLSPAAVDGELDPPVPGASVCDSRLSNRRGPGS